MFNAFLNYSASTYEAIIAAFIVLGLIQSVALARKAGQARDLGDAFFECDKELVDSEDEVADLKRQNLTLVKATTKAMFSVMGDSFKALAKMADKLKAAEARANAAERSAMELSADIDDIMAEREVGRGRAAAAVAEKSWGVGRGQPSFTEVKITPDDVLSLLRGDASALENKVGAKCIGIEIVGEDGRVIEGPEAEALVASFLNRADRKPCPTFVDVDETALKAGTRLHEEIERGLRLNPEVVASFDRSAVSTNCAGDQPDESCSTQQPHNYAASSPRAG